MGDETGVLLARVGRDVLLLAHQVARDQRVDRTVQRARCELVCGLRKEKGAALVVLRDAAYDVVQSRGAADCELSYDAGALREMCGMRRVPRRRALLGHTE